MTLMREKFNMDYRMDMVYISGIMEIDTKDILRMGKGKKKIN
jgi:hypothetical protein